MEQKIYINLDDSGKLTRKEKICVYGGIVFISKNERDKYINTYKKIIEEIRCKYCKQNSIKCNFACPEIKNTNILNKHKHRILNYNKRYYTVGLVIENDKIYDDIVINKASRGRFIDYTIKILIKEIIKDLINKGIVNPNKDLKIIIDIDEQTTKTNGYYSLKDSIYEELKYGISNFEYGMQIKPIIHAKLSIILTYRVSSTSYIIQAADLIAGTIRKTILSSKDSDIISSLDFITYKTIFPRKKTT